LKSTKLDILNIDLNRFLTMKTEKEHSKLET